MNQPNPPALTPGQVRYVRKAIALRKRLTYKALAARLCVAPITVQRAAHGRCED